MSLSAAIIDALVEAGATVEQLAAAMKASIAEQDTRVMERRQKDAVRQRKSRASRNVTVTPRDKRDRVSNEYISNLPEPQTANAVSPPFSEKVVSDWNAGPAKAGAAPSRKLNTQRQAHLRARVKENGEEAVLQAIRNVSGSKFHCGENDRGWKINLGWMLKSAENFDKCLELAPPLSPSPSGKQWTEDEKREYLAKIEARTSSSGADPPPAANREATSFGKPIGDLVSRLSA
jgi:hypothetical protein